MPDASLRVPDFPGEYAVGDVIGEKYRLEQPLGEGGQAWVWQARHLVLDGRVAIKVLRSDTSNPEERVHSQRLLQEARAAAKLGHPAIVRVFDLGETPAGDPYLVMELLEGISLGDRLVEAGHLSPTEALRVLLPIADALVMAHATGIVHRDLKPDNVFLALSGEMVQPKLLDFGVAKLQPELMRTGHLTDTGAVVGSPAYLSPEQARGTTDIDQRVDVWSFCAMLYECLVGELPFGGSNYNALLRSIVEDEPPSIVERGIGDGALWAILQRGLAKSRDDRWPSMRALGVALSKWLLDRGVVDDVCGVSLELRWMRSVTPRDLLRAPKALLDSSARLRPEQSREARQSLTLRSGSASVPVTPAAPANKPRIVLVGVALAAALALAWLAFGFRARLAPSSSASLEGQNQDRAEEKPAMRIAAAVPSLASTPVVVPLPVPILSAAGGGAAASQAVAPDARLKPAPRPRPSVLPAMSGKAPASRKLESDLLNPY